MACEETVKTNKGKAAVSGVLAATLACGMVPAVALAQPAEGDAAENDGVGLLNLTEAKDFAAGAVTGLEIGDKAVADLSAIPVGDVKTTGDSGETALDWTVTKVKPLNGKEVDLTDYEVKCSFNAGADKPTDSAGDAYSLNGITTPGDYWVKAVVTDKKGEGNAQTSGPMDDWTIEFQVKVVANSLKGAVAYEASEGAADGGLSDTSFEYTGLAQSIGFKLNGKELEPYDAEDETGDYTVTWYDSNNKPLASSEGTTAPEILHAGTYTAALAGKGDYEGTANVTVTVAQLDLSKATVVVNDATDISALAVSAINGKDTATAYKEGIFDIEVRNSDGNLVSENDETGEYTITVKAADPKSADIVGSAEVRATVAASDSVQWEYYGTVMGEGFAVDTVDLSETDPDYFVPGAVKVYATNTENGATSKLSEPKLERGYTVTDADGNAASEADLKTAGTWYVTYRVDAKANDYLYGGTKTVEVRVINGNINIDRDIVVMQDGKVKQTPEFVYDDTDALKKIEITVRCGSKTLVQGTDYTLTATEKGKSEELSEAVNAGAYTVTVKSETYGMVDSEGTAAENDSFEIVVGQLEPTGIRVAGLTDSSYRTTDNAGATVIAHRDVLPYTGGEITPVIEYTTDEKLDNGKTADQVEWKALPADAYAAKYTYDSETSDGANPAKAAKALKEKGTYKVELDATEGLPGSNYNFKDLSCQVVVDDADRLFLDVPSDKWYYDEVNAAAELGYVNGYEKTNLFGPGETISRAMVVQVLYNMAGGKDAGTTSGFQTNAGYRSQFSDVVEGAWYAQAVAWAEQVGIAKGYGDGAEFGPNDPVSRQDFCVMLARYERAKGGSTKADTASVLATAADGARVSAYAQDDVAWAVEGKVIAQGSPINPTGTATRAEVAAMCVRYQPEKLA